jgi:hypothetical protein
MLRPSPWSRAVGSSPGSYPGGRRFKSCLRHFDAIVSRQCKLDTCQGRTVLFLHCSVNGEQPGLEVRH